MRRVRQSGLLPPELAKNTKVSIVGVGTLGSWAALALAKMGVGNLDLWDGDKVEMVNVPLQVYTPWDRGKTKLSALLDVVRDYTVANGMEQGRRRYWEGEQLRSTIVVSGVDSFEARRALFTHALTPETTHFIDLRSGRETLLTYCIDLSNDEQKRMYTESLQSTPLDLDCHEQGIVYVGMRAGAEVAAMVASILRGMPVPPRQTITTNMYDTDPLWSVGG